MVGRFQAGLRLGFFLNGVAQQQINDAGNGGKIERKEENAGSDGDLGRCGCDAVGQKIIKKPGERGQKYVGDKPGDGLARADKKQGPNRRQQPPQTGATGGNEVADTPLHGEWRKKEERQLRITEKIKIAAAEKIEQVADQQNLENKWRRRRKLRPHLPVEEEPEHGTEANQASRKDQQRLLQTRLGIVIRINAGIAQGEKKGWLAQGSFPTATIRDLRMC